MEDLNNQKPGQTSISISSTETALNHKLSHLQKVFTTFNNYQNKVVDNTINTERTQTVTTLNEEDQTLENNENNHRCAQQPKQQDASYLQHQKT